MVSRYVTNGPVNVKQEGICLLPPPPHYRMIPPQRADTFHVTTPVGTYVSQQQANQAGNQGPGLRGIAQAGPPNQASTPPTNDLKVQSVSQQQSMNHMYVQSQQPVRGTQGTFYRSSGPPNQTPRMPNQTHRNQQVYQTPTGPFVQMPIQQMYISPMQYYNGPRQQAYVQPTAVPVYSGQHIAAGYSFTNPAQTQSVPFSFYPQINMTRAGHPPQATSVPLNPTQTIPNIQLSQSTQPQFQRQQNRRERPAKAIPIIDPATGEDKLSEMYQDRSHPPSGESSARQTPQPLPQHNKEVQAMFAKQVALAINDEVNLDDEHHHHHSHPPPPSTHHQSIPSSQTPHHHAPSTGDHLEQQQQQQQSIYIQHSNTQQQQSALPQQQQQQQIIHQQSTNNSRLDHIVQSSNLKPQAKEFSLNTTAKEVTPIVSANCDAVEVTLPSKQSKDRESPAKGRKQQQQQQREQTIREHKDSTTISINKETITSDNKESSIIKNDNIKFNIQSSSSSTAAAPASVSTLSSQQQQQTNFNKDNISKECILPLSQQQQRDDNNKNQIKKKDNKIIEQQKLGNIVENENIIIQTQTTPAASLLSSSSSQDLSVNNAKSKQNASQRAKDVQKQQQQQQQAVGINQQKSVTVPQPQPAKANNKSSKKSELNQKGANKEGTDMDAFNDSRLDTMNANITTPTINSTGIATTTISSSSSTSNTTTNTDIINANSLPNINTNLNSNVINNNNNIIDQQGKLNDITNITTTISSTIASITTTTTTSSSSSSSNSTTTTTNLINDLNKKNLNNNDNVTTINNNNKFDPKLTLTTNRTDVKSLLQSIAPKFVTSNQTSSCSNSNSQDETDRILPTNQDQLLVQVKNETNSKLVTESNNNFNNVGGGAVGGTPVSVASNISSTSTDTTRTEVKIVLPYRENQWAPNNLKGEKIYERDFLLAAKNLPASQLKPETLIPDVIQWSYDDRSRVSDGRYSSSGGRTDFMNPPFNYGSKSGSQRGGSAPTKRPSLSGKAGSNNASGKNNNKPNMMRVSISVREEVKLHEAENAWKPARLKKSDDNDEDSKKTELLYNKVRGVLNKLTPQKFDTLVRQVRDLKIDTSARLQGVIDLVFEKAVDEPNFSVAYALMCRELALMQVPTTTSSNTTNLSSNDNNDKSQVVNFRKLLITRCQIEFEKQSHDESIRNEKVKEIDQCNDPEKKKELQFDLQDYDRKLRMKSVGNIRFIGELFKQQMLTVKIMLRCLENLLASKDEESLECLCKLLTTIGKELEVARTVDLSYIFNSMKDIVDKKFGKVTSRVRFMLQDVLDLRKAKWVPRRQDSNPKTIDQIQKEAENEQLTIQAMNSLPIIPRKDDRMNNSNLNNNNNNNNSGGTSSGGISGNNSGSGGGGSGSGIGGGSSGSNVSGGNNNMGGQNSDRKRRNITEDGWQTTGSRNRTAAFTVQSDKLKNKPPQIDEPLGSRQTFGNWSRGSNIKNELPTTNTANAYAALENIDLEKRTMGPRSGHKETYSSKGPSLERYNNKSYDGRNSRSGSRSGSQHRSIDNNNLNTTTVPSQRSTPPIVPPVNLPIKTNTTIIQPQLPVQSNITSTTTISTTVTNIPTISNVPIYELSDEKLERRVKNNLEEFINDSCTLDEYIQDVQSYVPPTYLSRLVADGYLHVVERSKTARIKTGFLFSKLIIKKMLSIEDYCKGLEEVLSQADDLKIDIPRIWDYLAESLVTLICDEVLLFKTLHKCSEILIEQGHASKLLTPLFQLIINEKGPNFLQNNWLNSGCKFEQFMSTNDVEKFVKDNQLEFLCGGGGNTPVIGHNQLSFEQIQCKLLEFLNLKVSLDDVVTWITANVSERVKDVKFIRVLITAILENSIQRSKLNPSTLRDHYNLLSKYVDNNSTYELHCLYAIHALLHKMEHPSGLFLSIFDQLYEESVISQESFLLWEKSDDPAEQKGKGVALKQLTSFYTQLKENDGYLSTSEEEA